MIMKGLYKAFQPDFDAELPTKEKMALNLTDNVEKKHHDTVKMNQKAIICSVFQQCYTVEQVELQKNQGQDQLANRKGSPRHVSNSEGIQAGEHHGQNGIGACTGKVEARAQEGPK